MFLFLPHNINFRSFYVGFVHMNESLNTIVTIKLFHPLSFNINYQFHVNGETLRNDRKISLIVQQTAVRKSYTYFPPIVIRKSNSSASFRLFPCDTTISDNAMPEPLVSICLLWKTKLCQGTVVRMRGHKMSSFSCITFESFFPFPLGFISRELIFPV